MSDDWSTVSVKREQMKRELDALREHYLEHRATIDRLAGDAPTQHLAARYQELRAEIDAALAKLVELEGGSQRPVAPSVPPVVPPRQPSAAVPPPPKRWDEIEEPEAPRAQSTVPDEVHDEPSAARTFVILLLGFLIIAVLVFFGWRYLSGKPAEDAGPVDTVTAEETTTEEPVVAEQAAPAPLTMQPAEIDFGTVKKGSRVVRRFELVNNSDAPLVVKVERSACRCLWFDYADTIPPRGSTALTVTVDGARAQAGRLQEVVQVSSTSGEDISAAAEVRAVIE